MWQDNAFAQNKVQNIVTLADTRGKLFTILMLSLAAATGIYWGFVADLNQAFYVFTSVLIAACPCVLSLASPVTYGTISRYFAHFNFYLKNALFVENMAKVKSMVFDKTGTLTELKSAEVHYLGKALTQSEKTYLKSLLHASVHPLSESIERTLQAETLRLDRVQEFPGKGIWGQVCNHSLWVGKADFVGERKHPHENHATQGATVWVNIDGTVKGRFIVRAQVRSGLEKAIHTLSQTGYHLQLISGDNASDSVRMQRLFGPKALLKFEMSPQSKLAHVQGLKSGDDLHKVMMIGDGLNDAGALQASDIGISITEDDGRFFPASDGLLHSNQLQKLPQFVQLAKKSHWVVNACFAASIVYNIVTLALAVQGLLTPLVAAILMPLNSMTVVLIALGGSHYWGRKILKTKLT